MIAIISGMEENAMRKAGGRVLVIIMMLAALCLAGSAPAQEEKIVHVPESTVKLEDEAFRGNSAVREVILPEKMESIGGYAFYDCATLSRVNIPGSVERIGEHAFDRCPELKEITVPFSVSEIGEQAFGPDTVILTWTGSPAQD